MEKFQDEEIHHTDDDSSFEIIDWDEFYLSDSDQELSREGQHEDTGTESSDKYGLTDSIDGDFDRDTESPDNWIESSDIESNDEIDLKEDNFMLESTAWVDPKDVKNVVKFHVLPHLPAKVLTRFKAVSKEWNQWISSPFLSHIQSYLFRDLSGFFCQYGEQTPTFTALDHCTYGICCPSLKFLPESVVIRSSCNGLLLCQGLGGENKYYVCNPVNKEWRAIPLPSFYHGFDPAVVLAFETSELNIPAHFEIVCAFFLIDLPVVHFEIYSSEMKSWRCSAANCIEVGDSILKSGGYYFKRMAYFETYSGMILALDMKNDVCGLLRFRFDWDWDGVLTEMHGEVCYVHTYHSYENVLYIEVHGEDMGKRMKHKVNLDLENMGIRLDRGCRVLAYVGNDVVVILAGEVVFSYYLRDKKVERIISREGNFGVKYLPFVNSLVHVAPE